MGWVLVLTPLLAAVQCLRALWLALTGRETWAMARERIFAPRGIRADLWVHAASVGEIKAVRPALEALIVARPDLTLWITVTTSTARALVRDWELARITVTLAPPDLPGVARRAIARMGLRGLIVVENELWPNRILTFHRAALPVGLLNARISPTTARRWSQFAPDVMARMLSNMRFVAPQDAGSAERLIALGADPAKMLTAVNLKALVRNSGPQTPRKPIFLAASTHAGEEEIAISAYLQAREVKPDLHFILAPRHPDRAEEVLAIFDSYHLAPDRRSQGAGLDAPVLLLDTLGELEAAYGMAAVAFVGGSLVKKGGHTPFEPVAAGCPVLHGPHVANFADSYAALDAAGGAVLVKDAESLATAVLAHAGDAEMAARARDALPQPDAQPVIDAVRSLL